jgi:hypothetical protein
LTRRVRPGQAGPTNALASRSDSPVRSVPSDRWPANRKLIGQFLKKDTEATFIPDEMEEMIEEIVNEGEQKLEELNQISKLIIVLDLNLLINIQ